MNIAVTQGVRLMPPRFEEGLAAWSSENGLAGEPTYENASNATLIASDPDFSSCLEFYKDRDTLKLRWRQALNIQPGIYFKVTAKLKAMSGARPSARVAAWVADGSGNHLGAAPQFGDATSLGAYGDVIEISAIIGTGDRSGVDMALGADAAFAHFGIDLIGNSGGVVRVDDLIIEDITDVFHRELMGWIDVRDFGAKGDGVTNDYAAFVRADQAAYGRTVLIPPGTFFIGDDLTMQSRCRFEGRLKMADATRLILNRDFHYRSYYDAFENQLMALQKGLQALMTVADHESFDLGGRRVELTGPIDLGAALPNIDTITERRVIKNGQLRAIVSSDWDTQTVNGQADYDPSNPTILSEVQNISQIKIGSLVTGNGVGREIYVKEIDIAGRNITLSQGLHSVSSRQQYSFKRFQYMLDFSGLTKTTHLNISNIEFKCSGNASAVLMSTKGRTWKFDRCYFTSPKDRGLTSPGVACSGLELDNCEFLSAEMDQTVPNRHTIGFNCNANDVKIRDSRGVRFLHWGVVAGGGHIISGNHFWQGESNTSNIRSAGLVFTRLNLKITITGNYIDNSWLEFSNEHEPSANTAGRDFGGVVITSNIFTASNVPGSFRWIRFAPIGANRSLSGISVVGNSFKPFAGSEIERVEDVITSAGSIDTNDFINVSFTDNVYSSVTTQTASPITIEIERSSATKNWTSGEIVELPFGGSAKLVSGFAPNGTPKNSSNAQVSAMPGILTAQGSNKRHITVAWPAATKGKICAMVRCDTQR